MKAILFLAVLVFAAQSAVIHDTFVGFVDTITKDPQTKESIISDGLTCLNNVIGTIQDFAMTAHKEVTINKNYLEVIKQLLYTEVILQYKAAPICFSTYARIIRLLEANQGKPRTNTSNPFENRLYTAKMLQTLGRAADDFAHKRGYQAGENFATALGIHLGMINPGLPRVEQYNSSARVYYDEEKFFTEFFSGFYEEFGANQAQVNSSVKCIKNLKNATKKALSNPALNGKDFLPGLTAFLEGALMITDSIEKCDRVTFALLEKVVGAILSNPIPNIAKLYINYVLEALSINELEVNASVQTSHGQYHSVGRNYAKKFRLILKDIVF